MRQLTRKTKSSIICFVGPPGVGKSSLAKSIARATGRKFVRLSLGGVRDEAEIRGHRRTYIGAFPGQIIQMMRKAGTVNPVFLLDEVDKMSMDFRGDPSAALLEVLDPEQNDSFLDHYLDVDYDLSKVMFIATANVVHTIPPRAARPHGDHRALGLHAEREAGDRPAVPGAAAARDPRPRSPAKIKFDDEAHPGHHRELHPRGGRAQPGARDRLHLPQDRPPGGAGEVEGARSRSTPEMVGSSSWASPKFRSRRKNEESEIGVATGLAWTEVGGELLETEVGLMPGKGKLTLTGKLGEVMQESAQRGGVATCAAAPTMLGIEPDFNERQDIHIHVPEGAIPKDGPSAGITMATALVSALTKKPVRKDVAMTGEITLRGKVLPVGGIKDKVLAAFRGGITEMILPQENEKDLEEIPEEIRGVMEFHLVESMDEVLRHRPRPRFRAAGQARRRFGEGSSEPPVGPDSLN